MSATGATDTSHKFKVSLSVSGTAAGTAHRTSQAEIIISISPADAPTVATQYVTPKRMNPSDSLKITGIIGNINTVGVNCTWSVDDASINLPILASTPTLFLLMPSSIGQYVLNFALPSATLRERASFVFTLSCVPGNSVIRTSSSLLVSTNGPPLAGQFIVTPTRGLGMNTSFMFLSSKWFDEDLPLSYHYGFVSSGALMTLQSRSEISYGNSKLPVGDANLGYTLKLFAQVFDVMNAQTTVYDVAVVNSTVVSTKLLKDLISAELSNGAISVDNTKKVIGLVSSIMNNVDCSKSPNCTALNRSPCNDVANTCGVCVSNRFTSSDEGHSSNSPCIRVTTLQNSVSSSSSAGTLEPTSCLKHTDCWGWQQCVRRSCISPEKLCQGNCSGHGSCKFQDEQSFAQIKTCKVGDASCVAYCECNSKPVRYSGSTCSKTHEDMKASQALRGQLLLGLKNLTKSEDLSPETASSWISNLGSITGKTDEISSQAVDTVGQVLSNVVSSMEKAKMIIPTKSAAILMDSLSNNIIIAKNTDKASAARRRRLSGSDGLSAGGVIANYSNGFPEYLKKPMDMISRFGELMASDMVVTVLITHSTVMYQILTVPICIEQVPGQPPISYTKSQFRLTTAVLDHSAPIVNVSVVIPQTTAELALNRPTPKLELSVPSAASSSTMTIKAVVLSNTLFDNAAMLSNVVHVSSCAVAPGGSASRRLSSDKPTSIKVVLPNNNPSSLKALNSTVTKPFELSCVEGRESSLSKTCPLSVRYAS